MTKGSDTPSFDTASRGIIETVALWLVFRIAALIWPISDLLEDS